MMFFSTMQRNFCCTLIIQLLVSLIANAQTTVTVSGIVKDKNSKASIAFVNVVLKNSKDSSFVSGAITNEEGRFNLVKIKSGNYYVEVFYTGYITKKQSLFVGTLTEFLDIKTIEIEATINSLQDVVVTAQTKEIGEKMDKKTFSLANNISQTGGSVLQAMQNLPSITIQDGKVLLRGNDKVVVLIDGKQTALTGFGSQTGLDNIPASAIDRIEIINNPSAKYDANGNAGIINIIYKKINKKGLMVNLVLQLA